MGYATALLMAFPYFCCLFHYEVRAEDWCQPFIAASLYCLLKEILRPSAKSASAMGIVFGLSFMAALLIKWSVAVMTMSFAASGLVILVRRKRPVAGYILCFGVGRRLAPMPVYCIAVPVNFLVVRYVFKK